MPQSELLLQLKELMKLVSDKVKEDGVEITYVDASGKKTVFVPYQKVGVTGKLRPVLDAELIGLLPSDVQKKFN